MRICLVYDCLFPHTIGGAERWYRNLGERLAADGHDVTYLTLRQWERGHAPEVSGVRVRAVGPRMSLYAAPGRRRILPPLVFGVGVLCHLLRHGRRYDAVHTASFPYFSLLAAGLMRPRGGYRLVVDWHEVWSRDYWREYLGRIGGQLGFAVQALCMRIPQRAFSFSRLHSERLRTGGLRGVVSVLEGEYDGASEAGAPRPAEPFVLFAGRHIPEKQVTSIPPALALARRQVPELGAIILGDGPDRGKLIETVRELGLTEAVRCPGFVSHEVVQDAMSRALCTVLPSRREGYGMVVIESASRGTPSIVVAATDNAATELVSAGENGIVAPSATPEDLAQAIVAVHSAGFTLRQSSAAWFDSNARRLSARRSQEQILAVYRGAATASR